MSAVGGKAECDLGAVRSVFDPSRPSARIRPCTDAHGDPLEWRVEDSGKTWSRG